jgi:hypothetical protein
MQHRCRELLNRYTVKSCIGGPIPSPILEQLPPQVGPIRYRDRLDRHFVYCVSPFVCLKIDE